jgi:hypothetical protein
MKVRKEVSLTVETAEIANRMNNFSQWVRVGLREYKNGNNLAAETLRRIRFAQAALHLASEVIHLRQQLEIPTETDPSVVMGSYLHANKGVTLEDYE